MHTPLRIALLAVCACGVPSCRDPRGRPRDIYYLLKYSDMQFLGPSRSSFNRFRALSSFDRKMPPVYVRHRGRTYFLPEMTQAEADTLRGKAGSPACHITIEHGRCTYFDGWAAGMEISNRKDGPFYKLPVSENDVVAMFGKPTKRTKVTRGLARDY